MMQKKRLFLLVNPTAGKSAMKGHLLSLVDAFVRDGFVVTVHTTQSGEDIVSLVAQMACDCSLVVCCGGDGTLNQVVNGLMRCVAPPVLGYIPTGTTNDFANSFRLPKNIREATEIVLTGVPTPFDVGRFSERYFTYVAAFGAFTDVTYQTPQEYKNLLGRVAYLLEGASQLPHLQSTHVRVTHDGGVLEDDILLGIVTNSRYVAGLPMGKMLDASMNDGIMEVMLVKKPTNLLTLAPLINNFLLGEIDKTRVHVLKTSTLHVEAETTIPWTLDGEYGGTFSQVQIDNVPRALHVIAPRVATLPDALPPASDE